MTSRGLTITVTVADDSGNAYTAQQRVEHSGRIPRVFGGKFKAMMSAAASGAARRAFVKWHEGEVGDV